MLELLIDNDVLIKTSRYGLAPHLMHLDCPDDCAEISAVLGAARFVVAKNLARSVSRGDADPDCIPNFEAALELFLELEPTHDELQLASMIEQAAIESSLELDAGESQLFAIAVLRGSPVVLTGDKRAIVALEGLLSSITAISALESRVACFEQLMLTFTTSIGAMTLRSRICADRGADRTMGICFRCTDPAPPEDFEPSGLQSYINDLRKSAPTVLRDGEALSLRA